MLTEDYCSFEVAKLLKEKGFDEMVSSFYPPGDIQRPTHQMAMKWLREKYNIYISILPDFPSDKDYKMCWCWSAGILHENCISLKEYQCYIDTYEEATEAAIKYSLENLL